MLTMAGCSKSPAPAQISAKPSAPATAKSLFQNVAAQAGLKFTHDLGNRGRFYFDEQTPAGCAFLDYDSDGDQDILLVQSGSSAPAAQVKNRPHGALFRNNGDGKFTDVTAGSGLDVDLGYGQGVSVADYDNDGFSDLFITSYGGNHLFHNQGGSGKWKDVTRQMGLDEVHETGYATSSAWGDYNGDGKLDLYVCYYSRWSHAIDKQCRDAQTKLLDYCEPTLYEMSAHQLFRNEGARFVDVSAKTGIAARRGRGLAVSWLDYNVDGKPDVFVANDGTAAFLWRNNGNGTFTDVAGRAGCAFDGEGHNIAGMSVSCADYDHSGVPSVYVSNFSSSPNILFKNESGNFTDVTQEAGLGFVHLKFLSFGSEFFDYDADGWGDLIVNNGHVQIQKNKRAPEIPLQMRKQLLHNEGNGKFREITDAALLGGLNEKVIGRGLAVGDYDNDGRIDVLAMAQNAPVQLLRNLDNNGNHWVSFATVGTKSNRDGIGARLEIEAGGMRQSASVRSGSSYLSASDRRVYFGLGKTAKVDELTIVWPSGARETLKNLASDMFYTLTENKGVTAKRAPVIASATASAAASVAASAR